MGEVYGLATGKFAAQGMQLQVGLKWVRLQIIQHLGKAWLQVGMLFKKFTGLAEKLMRRDDGVHYAVSSASRAFSRSSAVLKDRTFPFLTSCRAERTRE